MNELAVFLEDSNIFNKKYTELGEKIGKLFTEYGLPIDMALSRINITENNKKAVLNGALNWLVEHKKRSGATEKSIDRQRIQNKKYMLNYLMTGEVGIY